MELHSGSTEIGRVEQDDTLRRALRFIEDAGAECPDDFVVGDYEDLQNPKKLIGESTKAPALVAQSLQYVLLRVVEVVRSIIPVERISSIEYRYINSLLSQESFE